LDCFFWKNDVEFFLKENFYIILVLLSIKIFGDLQKLTVDLLRSNTKVEILTLLLSIRSRFIVLLCRFFETLSLKLANFVNQTR